MRSLSRISLRWIISEILRCDSASDIRFDLAKLREIGIYREDLEKLKSDPRERDSVYHFAEDGSDVLSPVCVQRQCICLTEISLLSRWLQIPLSVICFRRSRRTRQV